MKTWMNVTLALIMMTIMMMTKKMRKARIVCF